MSKRDQLLREVLNDPQIMKKYNIREKDLNALKTTAPYSDKVIEVLATIINENDNGRTARQIYPILKNIHKI
ncbi:hypothetical protein [Aequorivita sinensis]|uniref:hypothetical protein n=1 Tax=Aequorivita sinensis TaxID=1382458 RepID=UPI00112076ED|nr:hypothetical protein [Aequorivita sinensis]